MVSRFLTSTVSTVSAWLVFLAISCASTCANATELRIELRDKVRLTKKNIVLADIAVVSCDNLSTIRRVLSIPMGTVNSTSKSILVQREEIERWVSRQLAPMRQSVTWSGANAVLLEFPTQELGGDKIVAAAEEELKRWLAGRGDRSNLQLIQLPTTLILPEGEVAAVARPIGKQTEVRQRMSILVDVAVAGKILRTVSVSFEIELYRRALVTKRDILFGETIDKASLMFEEFDITKLSSNPMLNLGDERKLRAKNNVRKGQILMENAVEAVPLAQRGEWATLVMSNGTLELESRVEVLKEGKLGDVIPVRAATSTGTIFARVIGEGKLEVKL